MQLAADSTSAFTLTLANKVSAPYVHLQFSAAQMLNTIKIKLTGDQVLRTDALVALYYPDSIENLKEFDEFGADVQYSELPTFPCNLDDVMVGFFISHYVFWAPIVPQNFFVFWSPIFYSKNLLKWLTSFTFYSLRSSLDYIITSSHFSLKR